MELSQLTTEKTNERTEHIDKLSTLDMLALMNEEDRGVWAAVAKILPAVAQAVELIAARLKRGGRLFYLGAGTSGRLGVLDAAECPPTFGTDPALVQGLIAGGNAAMFKAQEGAEDDPTLAEADLRRVNFTSRDVLLGIAASGRTPYVIGGLRYARKLSAATVALACVENPALAVEADILLNPVTGAEVIAGSTRLKAGTAQKLTLNMISTAVMIKLGKVYGNLMVDVRASNEKLRLRARRMVMTVGDCSEEVAENLLEQAGGGAKLAIFMAKTGLGAAQGEQFLQKADGRLSLALDMAKGV